MAHQHTTPRIAYFPDSFHEVNGVACTSAATSSPTPRRATSPSSASAPANPLRPRSNQPVPDPRAPPRLRLRRNRKDLAFDPLFWRHLTRVERALDRFRPDLIHITGPSELGLFGAWFARQRGLPLAASWHTNVHEYAARRLNWLTSRLPTRSADRASAWIESTSLQTAAHLYRQAKLLFAPNRELCDLLERLTRRPCHLMQRGDRLPLQPRPSHPPRRTRQPG